MSSVERKDILVGDLRDTVKEGANDQDLEKKMEDKQTLHIREEKKNYSEKEEKRRKRVEGKKDP